MPVKIVRRNEGVVPPSGKEDDPAPVVKKAVAPAPVAGRPDLHKTVKIGTAEIRPDIDVHDEMGKTKFLVHLHKPGLWFQVKSFDDLTGALQCRSIHGTVFDTKINGTVPRNYMVVVEPGVDVLTPSKAVVEAVQRLMETGLPDSIQVDLEAPKTPSKPSKPVPATAPTPAKAKAPTEPPSSPKPASKQVSKTQPAHTLAPSPFKQAKVVVKHGGVKITKSFKKK